MVPWNIENSFRTQEDCLWNSSGTKPIFFGGGEEKISLSRGPSFLSGEFFKIKLRLIESTSQFLADSIQPLFYIKIAPGEIFDVSFHIDF